MQATARIHFHTTDDKRTKDKLCPVKLCVYHNSNGKRVRKYYSITDRLKENSYQFIKEEDIEKVYPVNKKTGLPAYPTITPYKDIRKEYDTIKQEAEAIINDLPQFSFNLFEERYFNKTGSWDNVFAALWSHIQDLKAENRLGYASSFESTLRAVKEFHEGKAFDFNPRKDKVKDRAKKYLDGKELRFVDITASWLKRFDKSMQEQGKSTSTIGIYGRNLRVLFNLAIKKHKVKAEYPFTDYEPKSASGRKLALKAQQIRLIAFYEFKPDDKRINPEHGQLYRDIFMFSYIANGMNLSDLARLKYSNIKGANIEFVRKKTEGKANEVKLKVTINPRLQAIIDRHGNKAVGHDAYIFKILKQDMNEAERYAAIKQLTKQVNKYIRFVAKEVGIKERISSYTARHSWATIAMNNKTTTEFMKVALGHSSVAVTEKYLGSFDESALKEHSEMMEDVTFNEKAG